MPTFAFSNSPLPLSKEQVKNALPPSLIGFGLIAVFATALAVVPGGDRIPRQTVVETIPALDIAIIDHTQHTFFSETQIQRGDTLQRLLARLNIDDSDALGFLKSAPEAWPIRQEFIAGRSISANASGSGRLIQLHFPLGNSTAMLVVRRIGSQFEARIIPDRPETHVVSKSAQIEHSLFGATDAAEIPDAIAIQLAEIFGSEIDFHTDLRKGDRFTVTYETRYQEGQPVRSGQILAAEFVNDGRIYRALWHDQGNGKGSYLTPDGKPIQKAFLRSPLEFSRISSGFSLRFHPILKAWRAHQGVDYAAPTGATVRATANATVEFAGQQKGYGNVVILQHDGKHSTLYAHLVRFRAGLRRGSRVNQGETIGYVGQTGWATGPHLHYEFRVDNKPINPLSAKIPLLAPSLASGQLEAYRREIEPHLVILERMHTSQIVYME